MEKAIRRGARTVPMPCKSLPEQSFKSATWSKRRGSRYDAGLHINVFETGSELRAGLTKWIGYYNTTRPHSALAGATPDEAYGQIQAPPYPGLAPDGATTEHKLAA